VEEYRRRARQLGVAERTHFLGPRPNSLLGHFLRQADVLVSPRVKGDNTPMKIYSYLDSERPVLATRLRTHTQVLDDEIAFLVEPDPASMARGLATLLRDTELRELLAFRAKLKVEQFYGPEAFERKVNDFYGQLEQAIKS
jgi:glycosyltransferase involved in cell wall biosynthesis